MNTQGITALRFVAVASLITVLLVCASSRSASGQANSPAPQSKETPEQEVSALLKQARELMEKRDYDAARQLLEGALAIVEKVQGERSSEVAKALVDLGMLYFEKQEAGKGVPLLERALRIDEKRHGVEHIAITRSLSPLAFLKYVTGDYAGAEELYNRMLAIYVKVGGIDSRYNSTPLSGLANVYKAKGDYEHAGQLFERVLAIEEKAEGADHPRLAITLESFADLHSLKRDYERAEPLLRRALAIREKAFGTEHPLFILTLDNLGKLYKEKGDFARAEEIYKRVLAIREKAQGAQSPEAATALNNLALLYVDKGDYALAEPLFQRALEIREKNSGPEHPVVAKTLGDLATLYKEKGDYARALELYRRALAIYEKAFGPESSNVATTLNNLAGLYSLKGDYATSEQMQQRALAIREKVLGAEHPDLGDSLNNLAILYEKRGDPAQAEQLYRRALTLLEKALGPNHPKVATALNNLASLYREQADYAGAEPLLERALQIREKTLGSEHPDVANSVNSLGQLLYLKGDYKRAAALFQRALAIREKTLGAEHREVAAVLSNLGLVSQEMKDYTRAESLLRRALQINEKALGSDHLEVVTQLNNLAVLYYEQGDLERAEQMTRRALAIHEKRSSRETAEFALLLNSLAALYDKRGDYNHAEPLYRQAEAILEKSLGKEHPTVASVLGNLSLMYDAKGETERAVEFLARAGEVREHNLALVLNTGSEQQKLLYMATMNGETEYAVWFHLNRAAQNMRAARLALTTLLRRKGRALDAMSDQIGALRRRLDPQDRALLERLDRARSELAALIFRGPGNTVDPLRYIDEAGRLEAEIERLQAAVSARSAQFRAQSQPVTLEAVQAMIPPRAALIEMVSYRPFNIRAKTREERWGARRYAAYVLRPEGAPAWVDLGDAAPVDAEVARLRSALSDSLGGQTKRVARALDEKLMRPIRQLLGDANLLLLSPDGALNLVPFGALVDEQNKYLVERYTITYLTSGRDLLRLGARSEGKHAPLIVADPLFDESGTATAARRETLTDGNRRSFDFTKDKFSPLPGTAGEAKALSAVMPEAQILTGARASEGALKQVNSPEILHVATHGFFLADQKDRGGGHHDLAFDNRSPGQSSTVAGENPLLRSGLALAGANRRQSDAGEDGVLTALEASGLDLWGTKLVVLSACETGVGDVRNGDGVHGLRRALVLAGAESQLMSLWQVDDAATKELMVEYYKRLQAGEGRAEALRQVQLKMLKSADWNHPYFWASFIPLGQWAGMKD